MEKMTINVFELIVLIDASWHSGTILRHSIIQKAINVWYNCLNDNERGRVYEWANRVKREDTTRVIQKKFLARYSPDNQYNVTIIYKGEQSIKQAFLYDGIYFISETIKINEKFIIKKEKINLNQQRGNDVPLL